MNSIIGIFFCHLTSSHLWVEMTRGDVILDFWKKNLIGALSNSPIGWMDNPTLKRVIWQFFCPVIPVLLLGNSFQTLTSIQHTNNSSPAFKTPIHSCQWRSWTSKWLFVSRQLSLIDMDWWLRVTRRVMIWELNLYETRRRLKYRCIRCSAYVSSLLWHLVKWSDSRFAKSFQVIWLLLIIPSFGLFESVPFNLLWIDIKSTSIHYMI